MPRAGVSAGRFDDGWDWIDPERDRGRVGGEADRDDQACYDWSRSGDFRARPRARRLRAVPDPPRARAPRAIDADRSPRPSAAPSERPVRAERLERAVRAAAPLAPAAEIIPAASPYASGVRRTVTITGRGTERHLYAGTHRPARRPHERAGFQPDRIAMWAVLLGVLMILAAATSAHAALLH